MGPVPEVAAFNLAPFEVDAEARGQNLEACRPPKAPGKNTIERKEKMFLMIACGVPP